MKSIVRWTLSLLFAFLVMPRSLVYAQSSDQPFLDITSVNTEQFPNVTVTLFGDNLRTNLGALDIKLSEDGVDQPTTRKPLTPLGIRSAVIIAPDLFVPEPSTNQLKIDDEVTLAFGEFTTSGFFDSSVDKMAAYAINPSTGISVTIRDWTDQYTEVSNELTKFRQPAEANGSQPSLSALLSLALDQLKASALPSNTVRSIMLFVKSPTEADSKDITDELTQKFIQERVYVHIVVVKPESSAAPDNPLKKLAAATHSKYLEASPILTQTFALLADRLIQERTPLVLTYQASKMPPTSLEVSGMLPGNTTITNSYNIPPLPFELKPISITLLSPTSGEKITWPALESNQAAADSKPETIRAKIKLGEGDQGPQRNITSVEYTLSGPGLEGKTVSGGEAPNYEAAIEIAPPNEGIYQLKVTVKDQFGILSSIEPIAFQIEREASPTPIPSPTPVVEPTVAATIAPLAAGSTVNQPVATNDSQQQQPTAEIATQGSDLITVPYLNLSVSRNAIWVLLALSSLLFLYLLLPQSVHGFITSRFRKTTGPLEQAGINSKSSTPAVNRPTNEGDELARLSREAPNQTVPRPHIVTNSNLQINPATKQLPDSESTQVTIKPETSTAKDSTLVNPGFQSPIIASLIYKTGNKAGQRKLPTKLPISDNVNQIRIGRNPEKANLIIDDQRVSRLHATIMITESKQLLIQDDGGVAGTLLNGYRLQPNDTRLLQHEDVISFGGEISYLVEIITKIEQTIQQPEEATSI